MKSILCSVLALALVASAVGVSCLGQERGLSDQAKHEIARRGAMVEEVRADGKIREDGMAQVREALATPPSDAHKFILHVIVTAGCAPCELLKRDLESAPQLAKWVQLERIKQANGADLLQSSDESFLHVIFESPKPAGREERFAGVKVTKFPTLLLTPSLNGQWGDPAKVIRQLDGYNGKPAELDAWLTRTISEHAKKFRGPALGDRGAMEDLLQLVDSPAYSPNPYGPSPYPVNPQPYNPQPYAPVGPLPIDSTPVAPPAPPASGNTGLYVAIGTLASLLGLGGFVAVALLVWGLYRTWAKAQGKHLLLSDAEYLAAKQLINDALTKKAT